MSHDDEEEPDDDIIACWCGAVGTFDELFSRSPFDESCGGTGYLDCHCGGDQCICHYHGQEIECPGCDDCRVDDDDLDEDWYEDRTDDFEED